MSIWTDDNYRLRRKMARAATDTIADTIRDPRSAWMTILLAVTAEAVAVAASIIAADKISEFLDDDENNFYLIVGAPFAIGFLLAFAVGRLLQLKFHSPETAWIRSSFLLWTSAFAGGLINVIALYLLYAYFLG